MEAMTEEEYRQALLLDEFVQVQVQKERDHLQELIQEMKVHNKRMTIMTCANCVWIILYTYFLWRSK
jgi:predicted nucleic-acid-binding Zn-ribbon protein